CVLLMKPTFCQQKRYAHPQQLDINIYGANYGSLPKTLPGRVTNEDFVHFLFHSNINPADYIVVIESMDTSGPQFRSMGPLMEHVELPPVHFPWEGKIQVIPKHNAHLPRFVSNINRGSTYHIPKNACRSGLYQMERHGVSITSL